MTYEVDGIKQIDKTGLAVELDQRRESVVFLDVRENEEYEAGHIPGVKLLPTSEFAARYTQELDKNKEYIIICRSGNRSQMVCQFLKDQGFEHLQNFMGGMLEWDGPIETGKA